VEQQLFIGSDLFRRCLPARRPVLWRIHNTSVRVNSEWIWS